MRWVRVLVGVGVLAVVIGQFAVVGAQTLTGEQGRARCSLATLKGTYVFANDGVQIVDGKQVPFAWAGIGTYDGRGHLHGVLSGSENGTITRNVSFTGTYTVNRNCIGTETDTDATGVVTHYDQFVAPDGSLFSFIQTDPGFVTSAFESLGTAKRVGD